MTSNTQSSSSRNTRSNKQNANNNRGRQAFKGDVKGMDEAVLQFPHERAKGSAAQYERFLSALKHHIGRDVSEGQARLWTKSYVVSNDKPWRPSFPVPPSDKTDVEGAAIHKSKLKAFEDEIGADWPTAKLEIWSSILGQCYPKLHSHLQQSTFFDTAEPDYNCITLYTSFCLSKLGIALIVCPYSCFIHAVTSRTSVALTMMIHKLR